MGEGETQGRERKRKREIKEHYVHLLNSYKRYKSYVLKTCTTERYK